MRVGERILEVCEILEELGPGGSGDVAKLMGLTAEGKIVGGANASKYCARAVEMGLLTVDKSPINNHSHYNIYTVAPDWRERIKGKTKYAVRAKPYARPAIKRGVFSFASSIFGLAS